MVASTTNVLKFKKHKKPTRLRRSEEESPQSCAVVVKKKVRAGRRAKLV
jgi:hypothetical protein